MKKIFKIIILLALLGSIVATGTWLYVFRKADSSVASRKADIEISAQELVLRFETNETAANTEFLDKVILVEGNIESVNEDSLGISISLKNPDEIAGVICSFSKSEISIKNVSVDNRIKVKGLCTGYLMDVVLNKCSIVK